MTANKDKLSRITCILKMETVWSDTQETCFPTKKRLNS